MALLHPLVRTVHLLGMVALVGRSVSTWYALREDPGSSLPARFEWLFWAATGAMVVTGVGNLGALGDVLPGVGTVAGALAFGYHWALALVAVGWVLAGDGLFRDDGPSLGRLLARGVAGAALVGTAFVGSLALVAGLVGLASGGEVLTVLLVTLFGTVGGSVGGAVVGPVLGLVNAGLARSAEAVVDRVAA